MSIYIHTYIYIYDLPGQGRRGHSLPTSRVDSARERAEEPASRSTIVVRDKKRYTETGFLYIIFCYEYVCVRVCVCVCIICIIYNTYVRCVDMRRVCVRVRARGRKSTGARRMTGKTKNYT